MMEQAVLIMMATYNGEKYLCKQINSILDQNFKNWHLVVQDDGSTDRTMEILREYANKDYRIELLQNDSGVHGAFINFHVLADKVRNREEYDYYMFCDQDDVWLPDKIQRMISYMKLQHNSIPMLCYADMRLIDENDNIFCESINSWWKIETVNEESVFFSHKIFGCNLIMNRKLFEKVPALNYYSPRIKKLSHDNFYGKYAATYGSILYMPEVTMNYRRHQDNATSHQHYTASLARILQRVMDLNALASDQSAAYNQTLTAIAIILQGDLTEKERSKILQIQEIIYKGGLTALKYVNSRHIVWGKTIENISRKFILTTGLYKKYLIKEQGNLIQ